MSSGSLVCVGTGIMLGAHINPISRSYIEEANIVFSLMTNHLTEQWVSQMNANTINLQPFYQQGKDRQQTYNQMINAMMTEVRAGKRVVGAFYGHPGVFAWVPHAAIKQARSEGFIAHMEPGISAEDCLIADLGIDPGKYGCQQFETSQFMFFQRVIDTAGYLILWQPAVAGDQSLTKQATGIQYRHILLELLLKHYPANHHAIIYEAATIATAPPRIEYIELSSLPGAVLTQESTLVIPPALDMKPNNAVLSQLNALNNQ